MSTHWNTVSKVKLGIKLYNFRLVWLFHSLHSIRPSLSKSRGNVATPYLFTCHYERLPVKQLQRTYNCLWHLLMSSNVGLHQSYRYSQSFSTVKRKQITVPCIELTAITWHCAVCNRFRGYGQHAWNFTDPGLSTLRWLSVETLGHKFWTRWVVWGKWDIPKISSR